MVVLAMAATSLAQERCTVTLGTPTEDVNATVRNWTAILANARMQHSGTRDSLLHECSLCREVELNATVDADLAFLVPTVVAAAAVLTDTAPHVLDLRDPANCANATARTGIVVTEVDAPSSQRRTRRMQAVRTSLRVDVVGNLAWAAVRVSLRGIVLAASALPNDGVDLAIESNGSAVLATRTSAHAVWFHVSADAPPPRDLNATATFLGQANEVLGVSHAALVASVRAVTPSPPPPSPAPAPARGWQVVTFVGGAVNMLLVGSIISTASTRLGFW